MVLCFFFSGWNGKGNSTLYLPDIHDYWLPFGNSGWQKVIGRIHSQYVVAVAIL